MKKFFTLFILFLLLSSCSDITPASTYEPTYKTDKYTATLTTNGYGKNGTLFPDYSEGNFSSIFKDDTTYLKANTNTTDSTGSSTNELKITFKFNKTTTVNSLITEFETDSTTNPSFTIKKTTGETTTSVSASWSTSQTISINDSIDILEVTLTLNKYNSGVKNNNYLKIIKLIPQF